MSSAFPAAELAAQLSGGPAQRMAVSVGGQQVPAPRYAARPPGRPRSERAGRAIIVATLEILVEGVSLDSLSMEAVSARAGVGKATLYRRWPNKEALVLDALATLYEPPAPALGESVRRDLIAAINDLRQWAADTMSGRLLPHLLGSIPSSPVLYSQYLRLVIEPRKAVMREILQRGVHTRELDVELDVEMTLTMLFGALLSRLLLSGQLGDPAGGLLPDADLSERIVDLILRGASSG